MTSNFEKRLSCAASSSFHCQVKLMSRSTGVFFILRLRAFCAGSSREVVLNREMSILNSYIRIVRIFQVFCSMIFYVSPLECEVLQ